MKRPPLWLMIATSFGAGLAVANWWHAEPESNRPSDWRPEVDPWTAQGGRLPTAADAVARASEFFDGTGLARDHYIGAIWLDLRGKNRYWVIDIWPPYLNGAPPLHRGERLGIGVGRDAKPTWVWLRGNVLVTTPQERDWVEEIDQARWGDSPNRSARRTNFLPPSMPPEPLEDR